MPTLKLDFEQGTSLSLESQLNRLAFEHTFLDNAIGSLRDIVPNLLDRLKNIYTNIASFNDDASTGIRAIRSDYNKVKARVALASYVNYNKMLISVPEGFDGKIINYTETLIDISPFVFEDAHRVLSEYCFFLSAFITNKENKLALKDHTGSFKVLDKRREQLTEEISKYFPNKSDNPKQYLGNCFDRFADVDVFVDRIEKLGNQLKRQNVKEISFSVKKSVDLLDIIIKDIQTNGTSKVSGSAALNISQGAYAVAQYVEFIAMYRFKVEQMVSTCEKLIKKFEEVL